jgi:hypothetical protein
MSVCTYCLKEMTDKSMKTCEANTTVEYVDGTSLESLLYENPEVAATKRKSHRCHDCGIALGGKHHPGCDMEECPKCRGQLISCGCKVVLSRSINEVIRKQNEREAVGVGDGLTLSPLTVTKIETSEEVSKNSPVQGVSAVSTIWDMETAAKKLLEDARKCMPNRPEDYLHEYRDAREGTIRQLERILRIYKLAIETTKEEHFQIQYDRSYSFLQLYRRELAETYRALSLLGF